MINNNINQKPCVVETSQGFSVSYKERFLYSKYNPSKLIKETISRMEIKEGSIILCFSPVLCYGLPELINKLPNNCLIYLCEFDDELQILGRGNDIFQALNNDNRIIFPTREELYNLPISIFNKAKTGKYRRITRINLSNGFQFYNELYKQLEESCINSIKTFWTNRLTLTKFGRKYSYNFFNNLKNIKDTTSITSYINAVTKPILIIGAGESTDSFISKFHGNFNDYFILCVDTILSPLIKRNIIPDGVFVEEAQTIISKAFLCKKYNVQLFAGLSSIPLLSQYFKKENISYFTTEFASVDFIKRFNNMGLLPPMNPPFGSVGLTAVYYGLKFRKSSNIPVYVTGLDFSYSIGKTHSKGTIAHLGRLLNNNKITSIENYGAAFSETSIKTTDKNGNLIITTPALSNYSSLFNNLFAQEINLYDIADSGLPLSIERKVLQSGCGTAEISPSNENKIKKSAYSSEYIEKLNNSLNEEVKELKELKALLCEKTNLSKEELKSQIIKKATGKEYLYLHFADGYCFNYNQSFLNRIRTEIDFFLKIFE